MSDPRPYGDSFADSLRHYLKQNSLKQSQLTHAIVSDLAQRHHDHWTKSQAAKKKRGEATPEDLAIYDAYPRKIGRVDALVAIRVARDTHPSTDFLGRVQEFSRAVARWPQGYRYKDGRDTVPYPASWFRSGRYLDDSKEWLPAGMFTRLDDPHQAVNRPEAGPLVEPEAGWRETVKTHEDLRIFQGRSWDTINPYYKRAIIKLCPP